MAANLLQLQKFFQKFFLDAVTSERAQEDVFAVTLRVGEKLRPVYLLIMFGKPMPVFFPKPGEGIFGINFLVAAAGFDNSLSRKMQRDAFGEPEFFVLIVEDSAVCGNAAHNAKEDILGVLHSRRVAHTKTDAAQQKVEASLGHDVRFGPLGGIVPILLRQSIQPIDSTMMRHCSPGKPLQSNFGQNLGAGLVLLIEQSHMVGQKVHKPVIDAVTRTGQP